MSVSLTRTVGVDRRCPRYDCPGWIGHVTYVQGESSTDLPVIEDCEALFAFVQFDEHQHCPLTQGPDSHSPGGDA